MKQITHLVLADLLRNRLVIGYALALALLSFVVLSMEDSPQKALLTMMNLLLLVVPLVCILYTTVYLYNSTEFFELLLSQPIRRKTIWKSMYCGLAISFALAFVLAAGIPLLIFAPLQSAVVLVVTGVMLSFIFIALAFLASILSRDKAKGMGIALLFWLYFTVIFDGLILFFLFQFSDYPIEKPLVFLSATSPIDLARIINLLQLDASAMMGYTGAIFKNYFGSTMGTIWSMAILTGWILIPYFFSMRIFKKKDL